MEGGLADGEAYSSLSHVACAVQGNSREFESADNSMMDSRPILGVCTATVLPVAVVSLKNRYLGRLQGLGME